MIKDLVFTLKMFAMALVIALVMQVKIGGDTLENHFHDWVQNSPVAGFFQDTADALLITGKAGLAQVSSKLSTVIGHTGKRKAGDEGRGFHFNIKRYNDTKEEADGASASSSVQGNE